MSGAPLTDDELAALSDEEFLNIFPTLEAQAEDAEIEDEPEEEHSDSLDQDEHGSMSNDDDGDPEEDETEDSHFEEEEGEPEPEEEHDSGDAPDNVWEGDSTGTPEKDEPEQKTDSVEEETASTEEAVPEIDYKAEYERIMAPFKAAGKIVQMKSPDDVIQLMQMGAHYTKKMQALQPNLKLLRMLENNELLDEGKLSYLIDLNRKDPAAIQKLVRESGLDPLDIDTSVEPDYQPGDHRVSDAEIMFKNTLDEVASDPAGKELIITINNTWDNASKDALWDDPNILRVLNAQKNNGIFDQITAEIERRKILGYLGNVSFLDAYKSVGEELQAQGALVPRNASGSAAAPIGRGQAQQTRRVVETRPAQQRKKNSNTKRARATSPTRTAPKKAVEDFNPLALSDEEFMKRLEMANKL